MGLLLIWEWTEHELGLEGREEALSDGVVPAVTLATHAADNALGAEQAQVLHAGIWTAPVGVMDHATAHTSMCQRALQGSHGEVGVVVAAGGPADHSTGTEVDEHREVEP